MEPIKTCGKCGAQYDLESWQELPHVGVGDYGEEVLELKNCAEPGCHSTLAIVVLQRAPIEEVAS